MPDNQDPQSGQPQPDPERDGRLDPESAAQDQSYSEGYDAALDPYAAEDGPQPAAVLPAPVEPAPLIPAPPPPPPKEEKKDEEEDEEEGMLRMSFLEHLEELRSRIIKALLGLGVAFAFCVFFTNEIWKAVMAPAASALKTLNLPETLAQLSPTEAFSIIWIKMPVLVALFLASPWVLYQVWAFIAPGLYKRERRLAVPFILSTAALFILGGAFAYFVAFRFALTFLLGIGVDIGVRPMISMTEYVDLFVNVILGIAVVFELPVLIFFLTLLRVASPRFLLAHSRYAILLIVLLAAIITPTPDIYNLIIFAAPMIMLYFVGVFASYLLVLKREGEKFPWRKVLVVGLIVLALAAALLWILMVRYNLHWVWRWPFLVR
jgi:sec-independent protein translocase protein TatC